MLSQIFISFVCVSAVGSAIAALLALIKPLTRRYFSASWNYYVLLAVMIIMLLPIRISLPEDVYSGAYAEMYTGVRNASAAEQRVHLLTKPVTPVAYQPENGIIAEALQAVNEYTGILSLIWLAVASVMFLRHFLSYAVMFRKLKRSSKAIYCPELAVYTRRTVTVMRAESASSPFTTGILRPIIVLPESDFPEEFLHHILAHEAIHINRHDMLFKWLAIAARCLHWFNPAVYFISRMLHDECEISCDSAVVRHMDSTSKASYMNTIMELASVGNDRCNQLTTALSGEAKILKRRFLMIKDKSKATKTAVIISVLAAVGLLGTGVFASGVFNDRYTKNVEAPEESAPEIAGTDTAESIVNNMAADAVIYEPDEAVTDTTTKEKVSDQVYIWPCDSKEISAPFNPEKNHYAADIRAEKGSDVCASINATVADTGFNAKDGNYIKLVSADTEVYLAHLLEANVEIGDTVSAGDVIGKVGSTGMATGPHLHYSLSVDGEYVDPVTVESIELIITE